MGIKKMLKRKIKPSNKRKITKLRHFLLEWLLVITGMLTFVFNCPHNEERCSTELSSEKHLKPEMRRAIMDAEVTIYNKKLVLVNCR